ALRAMRRFVTKNGRIVASVAGFALILIALLWVRLYGQLKEDRAETISTATQRNANLAVALEQYAIRTISNGDAVLQLVRKEYETAGNTINLQKLLAITQLIPICLLALPLQMRGAIA
ncbi:MAG TPA: hypothetical protein VEY10_12435, partial [Flavisolibacter sp.]|nr:hypothetical protein [Flavisolibacter sp.]